MKLLDVVTGPWAIQPEKLLEIQAIYATHLRGEKIDLDAVEKRLGRPLNNATQSYEIRDGVAIIPIQGVIAKRMNLMSEISGGVSSEMVGRDIKQAISDPAITAIVLSIDSPGGTVDGTQALAAIVASARGVKPIAAWTDGCMCSAAYWIGASADAIFAAADTVQVGSIGVVASHTDISGKQAAAGIKTTEIAAGKYKRVASQYGPLTEDGLASIQAQVDYLYSIFVADVAKARSVSEEKVIQDMADGRVFIGQQAVAAGLVDGVSTLDALIASLNQRAAGVAAPYNAKGKTMDRETLLAAHPDLAESIRAEGAQAERQRIDDVAAQSMPGHESLIASLKADGKTTGAEAAMQVLAAEKQKLAGIAAQLTAEAPNPVPHAAEEAAATELKDPREALHAKAKQYQADHPGTAYLAAINAVSAA
jgi:signal peptide peptidase SppA